MKWRDRRGLAWLDRFSLDIKLAARLLVSTPCGHSWPLSVWPSALPRAWAALRLGRKSLRPRFPSTKARASWDSGHGTLARSSRPASTGRFHQVVWHSRLVGDVSAADLSTQPAHQRRPIRSRGHRGDDGIGVPRRRVQPFLGRTLENADERPGHRPSLSLATIWRERFAGDRDVLGRTVRLGSEQTTVVGVMPEGFEFPAAHNAWVPLRIDRAASGPAQGLALLVFGRLAEQASEHRRRPS